MLKSDLEDYWKFRTECKATAFNQEPDNEFKIQKITQVFIEPGDSLSPAEFMGRTCCLCHIVIHLGHALEAPHRRMLLLFKDKKEDIIFFRPTYALMCMSCFLTKYVTMETTTGNEHLNDVREWIVKYRSPLKVYFTRRYIGAKTKRADDNHLVQG